MQTLININIILKYQSRAEGKIHYDTSHQETWHDQMNWPSIQSHRVAAGASFEAIFNKRQAKAKVPTCCHRVNEYGYPWTRSLATAPAEEGCVRPQREYPEPAVVKVTTRLNTMFSPIWPMLRAMRSQRDCPLAAVRDFTISLSQCSIETVSETIIIF